MFRDYRPYSLDYDARDVLVVEPQQLRALADDSRGADHRLLRERAAITTELAEALEHAEGNGRTPREGAREGRPHPRRPHAQGPGPDGEVLRPASRGSSCMKTDDSDARRLAGAIARD